MIEFGIVVDPDKKRITEKGEIIIGEQDAPISICGEFLTELLTKKGTEESK